MRRNIHPRGMIRFFHVKRMFRFSSLFVTVALLVSCAKKDSLEQKLPDPNINNSFTVKSVTGKQNAYSVGIARDSLEKLFLLIPQARSAETAGQWLLYQPQIVYFKRSGSQMGLFEANVLKIYDDISSDKLLQTFDVMSEDPDTIYFNWNYGLETIVMRESMGNTDPELAGRLLQGVDPVLKVIASFLEEAKFENNQLSFRQVARVRQSVFRVMAGLDKEGKVMGRGQLSEEDMSVTLEMRIRPYVENNQFQKLRSQFDKGYGYFTNYVTAGKGLNTPVELAQRWDITPGKPLIKFRLSKNIPAELVPAAVEGLEYWNRAVGRPILEIEKDVDPKSPIQERSVMVHWVDWRDAGFAYAGYQADPLTGEILQGQIFMTSFWKMIGQYYDSLGGSVQSLILPSPQGARFQQACQYHRDAFKNFRDFPINSLPANAEAALPHLIRSVIAHEAGHVVGLRHNFAASYYSGFSAEALNQNAKRYLTEGVIESVPAATSVMDYPNNFDELMLSKYSLTQVLDWDQKAIQWGYVDSSTTEKIKFCSDEIADDDIIGCARYDSSSNPLRAMLYADEIARLRGFWPQHRAVMSRMFPATGERVSLDDALNRGELEGKTGAAALTELRRVLSKEVQIHSVMSLKDWEHPELVEQKKTDAYNQLVSEVGLLQAFETVLPWEKTTDQPDLSFWDKQVASMSGKANFKTGDVNGISFQLSDVEADRLLLYFQMTSKKVATQNLENFNSLLPGPDPASDPMNPSAFVFKEQAAIKAEMPKVAERALTLMKLSVASTEHEINGTKVKLPTRYFKPETFDRWVYLFDGQYNKNADPMAKSQVATALKKELTPVFSLVGVNSPETISVDDLRKQGETQNWSVEVKAWVKAELDRIEKFEKALEAKPAGMKPVDPKLAAAKG